MSAETFSERIESRCGVCPNRSIISRGLARIGLSEVNRACPGPDTIDRSDIIKRAVGETGRVPTGYKSVVATRSVEDGRGADYYQSPIRREEHCTKDSITIGEDEQVVGYETHPEGRLWVRISNGDPEAVQLTEFDPRYDGHNATTGIDPLTALQSIRRVIINKSDT
jgi:hypothetical protein